MVVVDVANDLPKSRIGGIHVQSLADTIIQTDRKFVVSVVCNTVSVHVEDVAGGPISVSVPNDFVVQAHFERRVVGEDVAVHSI